MNSNCVFSLRCEVGSESGLSVAVPRELPRPRCPPISGGGLGFGSLGGGSSVSPSSGSELLSPSSSSSSGGGESSGDGGAGGSSGPGGASGEVSVVESGSTGGLSGSALPGSSSLSLASVFKRRGQIPLRRSRRIRVRATLMILLNMSSSGCQEEGALRGARDWRNGANGRKRDQSPDNNIRTRGGLVLTNLFGSYCTSVLTVLRRVQDGIHLSNLEDRLGHPRRRSARAPSGSFHSAASNTAPPWRWCRGI